MPRKSEFGRKWDVRVPRADIHWYVSRLHVACEDSEIAADIRKRCTAPGFTESLIRQSIAFALECHRRNQALYGRVARGARP